MSKRAFTLVELVMVIVIIGLLAAVVTPKFTNMRDNAEGAAEDAAVAAVKTGIKLAHMSSLAAGGDEYPATLDSASAGEASDKNPLFTEVIEGGITDANWKKDSTTTYTYVPTSVQYTYDKSAGTFKGSSASSN